MKKLSLSLVLAGILALGLVALSGAQEEGLGVEKIVICTGIESREPVGVDTTFLAGVSPLYCHIVIIGAKEPTKVSHVWYHLGEKRAKVTLPVKEEKWRTWSSKKIPVGLTGQWRVEVVSADGKALGSTRFTVEPRPGAGKVIKAKVAKVAVGTGIEERELVGAAKSFPVGTSPIFCHTLIKGAEKKPTVVYHAWYRLLDRGKKAMAEVSLEVKGKTWRTWSSKKIPKGEYGKWGVEVLAENGKLLEAIEFTVEG